MSNNEQQQKSFANIISKKDFDKFSKKEKEKFYIKNEILVKIKHKHSNEQLSIWKSKGRLIELTYEENPKLLDEIINQYLDASLTYWENDYIIDSIKIKVENALNKKEKEKIIKKEHRKYFKKLHKLGLSHWYFLTEEGYVGYGTKNFIGHVKSEIQDNIIEELLTSNSINFYNHSLFTEWAEIEILNGVLDFLKDYTEKNINNDPTTTNNKPTTKEKKAKDKYYSPVFLGKDEENVFFKILEILNAFNQNKNPKKRYFNPLCDAIFNSYKEYQKEIFKHNLKKSEYIHYLKSKYPNEFKSDRLSDGYTHIESVNEVFPQFIKMLKQQKLNKTTTSQQQTNNKVN